MRRRRPGRGGTSCQELPLIHDSPSALQSQEAIFPVCSLNTWWRNRAKIQPNGLQRKVQPLLFSLPVCLPRYLQSPTTGRHCSALPLPLTFPGAKLKSFALRQGARTRRWRELPRLLGQLTDRAPAPGHPCLAEQEHRRSAAASHPFLQLPAKMLMGWPKMHVS